MGFGEFLCALRKEKGMTQAELAAEIGASDKAVSKWETGEAMPETAKLLPLARIFGVSVDELLAGERTVAIDAGAEAEKRNNSDAPELHIFTRGKDDGKSVWDAIGGVICVCLLALSVGSYLFIGIATDNWHPYWVMIPVGALACGIIGVVGDMIVPQKREAKRAHGEKPIVGGLCAIVILSSVIAYLLVGALGGLWHPYWAIIVGGGMCCAVIGCVGSIVALKIKGDK